MSKMTYNSKKKNESEIECMSNEIYHYGILGMKWGVRRFQNPDGTLTPEGKARYYEADGTLTKEGLRNAVELSRTVGLTSSQKKQAKDYVDSKTESVMKGYDTYTKIAVGANAVGGLAMTGMLAKRLSDVGAGREAINATIVGGILATAATTNFMNAVQRPISKGIAGAVSGRVAKTVKDKITNGKRIPNK